MDIYPDLRTKRRIIYRIYHTVTGKSYIGQTIRTFCERYGDTGRWWNQCNWALGRDVTRDSVDSFAVEILENDIVTTDELDRLERYYICLYQSVYPKGYNLEDGGEHRGGTSSLAARQNVSKALRKRNEKERVLYDKEGIVHRLFNVTTFAEERGLDPRYVSQLVCGERRTYAGFAMTLEAFTDPLKGVKPITLIAPSGEEIVVNNMVRFCRENDLPYASMYKVGTGKQLSYKGWSMKGVRARKKRSIKKYRYSKMVVEKDGIETEVAAPDWEAFATQHGFSKSLIYQSISKHDEQPTFGGFLLKHLFDIRGNEVNL